MNKDVLDIETINGQFTRCIYRGFDYAVYRFEDEKDGPIIVTGEINNVDLKSKYELHGIYVDHPKYGIQFSLVSYDKIYDGNQEGIIAYLSSDIFPGIGPMKAKKIVNHFGDETLDILKSDVDRLSEVGLKEKDINTIKIVLNNKFAFEESFYWLIKIGFSLKEVKLIIANYQAESKNIIEDNPFRAYYDIHGITYLKCLEVAQNLTIKAEDERCLDAYLTYLLADISFKTGNTFFTNEQVKSYFVKKYDDSLFEDALSAATSSGHLFQVEERIYHHLQYKAEKQIVTFINKMHLEDEFYDDELLDGYIQSFTKRHQLELANEQIEAIKNFYYYNLTMICGVPGTGKTTTVKTLVHTIKQMYPLMEIHVVAPTGRAAKRISELCDVKSSTIHSLLKWNKENNTFTHDHQNPLLLDILIIDEFSMVDNWLFAKLLDAIPNIKKLCLIGDYNQLPSVGPGDLLYDLYSSNRLKVTELKTIFRQSDGNEIIKLSSDILKGVVDFSLFTKDIRFFNCSDDYILTQVANAIEIYLNANVDIDDIQVLSPMYSKGPGILSANNHLQNYFNPPDLDKNQWKIKAMTFREGDKILQLKNQNSDDICNGDIGYIDFVDSKNSLLVAKFNDAYVEYRSDDIANLSLAYCISIHKSQGSEYPIVILIVSPQHQFMLNKKLLYTACSRATKKLIIFGSENAFKKGINSEASKRQTSLINFLKDA